MDNIVGGRLTETTEISFAREIFADDIARIAMEKSPCNRGIPTILGLAVFYRQYKRIALYANGVPTAQKTSRSVTYVYNKIVRHVCIFLYRDKNAVILFLLCRIFFFLFFFQYIIAFLRGARGSVEPQNSKQSGEF